MCAKLLVYFTVYCTVNSSSADVNGLHNDQVSCGHGLACSVATAVVSENDSRV